MPEKFGLEFRIVDQELLRELRRERGITANPWTHFPRLIVSIDWLKRDAADGACSTRSCRRARPTYPRPFDLLIVDEVHNVAPGRARQVRHRLAAHQGDPQARRRTSSTACS